LKRRDPSAAPENPELRATEVEGADKCGRAEAPRKLSIGWVVGCASRTPRSLFDDEDDEDASMTAYPGNSASASRKRRSGVSEKRGSVVVLVRGEEARIDVHKEMALVEVRGHLVTPGTWKRLVGR